MKIFINNFRQEVKIGVTEQERAFPQIISLNIELAGDFARAIATDDLSLTIDYTEVCQKITSYLINREWQLMEKFVYQLAVFISDLNPLIESVELKACKNVMTQVDSISVSYRFNKNEAGKV